jgi:crescentin
MRTVSNFLSRAGLTSIPEPFPVLAAAERHCGDCPQDHGKALTAVGARIGEDNEALRNLLIDTGHQFSALDDLKETFGKLVDPLSKLMGTLENEKYDNAALRAALAESRAGYEALRAEFQTLGDKSSELEDDNERLRRDLLSLQRAIVESEGETATLAGETATMRVALANLEKRLGEEISSVRALSDEKELLSERAGVADKRIVELDAEMALSHESLSLLENEKNSLQTALDQTLSEASRTSRRLAESENALSDTRAQLKQTESTLAAVEDERKRLSAACDEANERRQTEIYALTLKHDAIRSRSVTAEKLLAEVRRSLVARSEELRIAATKLVEATVARNEAEKKTEQLLAATETQDRQIKKLEQAQANLTERYKTLSETVRARENSLVHAQEKIKSLTHRTEQLKLEAAATHTKTEKRIGELNAALERERVERTVAQGALETTRGKYDQMQRQMSTERALHRRGADDGDKVKALQPRPAAATKNRSREGAAPAAKVMNGSTTPAA